MLRLFRQTGRELAAGGGVLLAANMATVGLMSIVLPVLHTNAPLTIATGFLGTGASAFLAAVRTDRLSGKAADKAYPSESSGIS